jgi:hypothetical protein
MERRGRMQQGDTGRQAGRVSSSLKVSTPWVSLACCPARFHLSTPLPPPPPPPLFSSHLLRVLCAPGRRVLQQVVHHTHCNAAVL